MTMTVASYCHLLACDWRLPDRHAGEVLRSVNAHRTVKKSSLTGLRARTHASRWCTSLASSPYDHALYLCQYKVLRPFTC